MQPSHEAVPSKLDQTSIFNKLEPLISPASANIPHSVCQFRCSPDLQSPAAVPAIANPVLSRAFLKGAWPGQGVVRFARDMQYLSQAANLAKHILGLMPANIELPCAQVLTDTSVAAAVESSRITRTF